MRGDRHSLLELTGAKTEGRHTTSLPKQQVKAINQEGRTGVRFVSQERSTRPYKGLECSTRVRTSTTTQAS